MIDHLDIFNTLTEWTPTGLQQRHQYGLAESLDAIRWEKWRESLTSNG